MGEIFGRRELKTIRPGPQTPALVSSGTRNSRGIALNFDKGRTKDFIPQKKNHEGGWGVKEQCRTPPPRRCSLCTSQWGPPRTLLDLSPDLACALFQCFVHALPCIHSPRRADIHSLRSYFPLILIRCRDPTDYKTREPGSRLTLGREKEGTHELHNHKYVPCRRIRQGSRHSGDASPCTAPWT